MTGTPTEATMASGAIKKATGLTGMAVARDPHKTLSVVYNKILRVLQAMPQEAKYRQHTQTIVQDRLNHVKTEPNALRLERKINCGQLEEVILQAERELFLAQRMLQWRAWEPLVQEAPTNQWKWPI